MFLSASSVRIVSLLSLGALALSASAQVRVNQLARVGGTLPGLGGTITDLVPAQVTGNGRWGFQGSANFGTVTTGFVYAHGALQFRSDQAGGTVSSLENTIGLSAAGDTHYSYSLNSVDGTYTTSGFQIKVGDVAPNNPAQFVTFASRPNMSDDGRAYWVGGFGNVATTTLGRALYRREANGSITTLIKFGDALPTGTVSSTGIQFGVGLSRNGNNWIAQASDADGAAGIRHLLVSGKSVARTGAATGFGGNYQNFGTGANAVDNLGNWALAADTDEATTVDHILVYNGNLVAREGGTYAGASLTGFLSRNVALSNSGGMLHTWGNGANAVMFFTETNNLAGGIRLLGTGDIVDTDGDGIGDASVTTIINQSISSSHTIGLTNDNTAFFAATLQPLAGGSSYNAILSMPVPEPFTLTALGLAALAARRRNRRSKK